MSPEQFEQGKTLSNHIEITKQLIKEIENAKTTLKFGGGMFDNDGKHGVSKPLFETIRVLLKAEYEAKLNDLQTQFNNL